MNKKKVMLSGSYGTGNTGDEVILEVILEELKEYDVTVLSHVPSYTLEKFPEVKAIATPPSFLPIRILKDLLKLRFSNFKKRYLFIREVQKTDLFLLGGGGLLVEIATSVLAHYIYQLKIAQFFNIPTKLICVGVGIIRTNWGRKNLKLVLDNCQAISVRDEISKQNLININVIQKIHIVADPAFNYKASTAQKNSNLVAINCYNAPRNTNFFSDTKKSNKIQLELLTSTIKELQRRGYQVILIPLGTDIDLNYSKEVQENLVEGTGISLFETTDYKEIVTQLSQCHFTITMRFHAGLLSFVNNVPSICLDNQFKSERLLQDMQLSELLYDMPDGVNKKVKKEILPKDLFPYIDLVENNRELLLGKIQSYCQKKSNEFTQFFKKYIQF